MSLQRKPLLILLIVLLGGFLLGTLLLLLPSFLSHSALFNPQYTLPDRCAAMVLGLKCVNNTVHTDHNTLILPVISRTNALIILNITSTKHACEVTHFTLTDQTGTPLPRNTPLPKDQLVTLRITCAKPLPSHLFETFNVTYKMQGRERISSGTLEVIKN